MSLDIKSKRFYNFYFEENNQVYGWEGKGKRKPFTLMYI